MHVRNGDFMGIVDRIKMLAESKGMTVADVGEALGMGRTGIYRWNKSSPSVDKLQKVADYFDVSLDFLLGREKENEDRTIMQINRKAMEMTPEQREKALRIWEAAFDDEELWKNKK